MEYILLIMIGIIGIRASYTDIKKRKIYNKDIAIVGGLGVCIYLINYKQLLNEDIFSYLVNITVCLVVSFLFYYFKIWAAGDAKLLVVLIVLLPYKFYRTQNIGIFPAFYIIAMIFSVAFLYVVIETIVLMIKKVKPSAIKRQYSLQQIVQWVLSALTGYNIILLFDHLVKWKFYDFYTYNVGIMILTHLFLLMMVYEKIKVKKYLNSLLCITLVANIVIIFATDSGIGGSINIMYVVLVVMVLLLREKGSQYNYEMIPIEKVLPGMILAYSTILKFVPSRVKGLPTFTDETTKYRISEEEVIAIKRWKKSKYGEEYIMVVKHMPFAPFIFSGTILYLLFRLV